LGRYSSGSSGGSKMYAFLPFTTVSQGYVLKPKLSGISMVSLDYAVRFHETFAAGLTASLFIRSDLETYNAYPLSAGKSNGTVLGPEFFGRFLWSPVSDLQFNLGGGAFLPSMGDAASKEKMLWRVELNAIFSLY
jgi:hypothetical protein